MGDPLRFNDDLLYWEYLFASREEIDIEAELYNSGAPKDDLDERAQEDMRRALRAIDSAKRSGTYQTERAELFQRLPSPAPLVRHSDEILLRMRLFENFHAGLNSPDAEERAKFRNIWERRIDRNQPLEAALDILDFAPNAERRRGRPSVTPPWRNFTGALENMRLLLAANPKLSIKKAAVAVAERDGSAQDRSRQYKDFYKNRVDLRK